MASVVEPAASPSLLEPAASPSLLVDEAATTPLFTTASRICGVCAKQFAQYKCPACAVQYCNIEGIEWVDDGGADEDAPRTLVGVSDKMKGKGKQPFTCLEKDQSFHLFQLP